MLELHNRKRSSRDWRNDADGIYANQTVLLLALSGDPASALDGSIALAVRTGEVNSG